MHGQRLPTGQAAARARCTAGAAVKASAVHLIVAADPVPLRASCTAGSCLLQSHSPAVHAEAGTGAAV